MSREHAVRRDVLSDKRRNGQRHSRQNLRRSLPQPEQPQTEQTHAVELPPHSVAVRSRWQNQLGVVLGRSLWHPVTLLTASWMVCVVVAGFAAQNMIKVDPSELQIQSARPQTSVAPSSHSSPSSQLQPAERRTAERRTIKTPKESNGDNLPLTSLLAVAISCAAGSFILCHRSSRRKPDRRLHLSSRQRSVPASPASATNSHNHSHNHTHTTESYPKAQSTQSVEAPVRATLVPEGESHPLDWDEPSLADNLDLRQHRPLSHWL